MGQFVDRRLVSARSSGDWETVMTAYPTFQSLKQNTRTLSDFAMPRTLLDFLSFSCEPSNIDKL